MNQFASRLQLLCWAITVCSCGHQGTEAQFAHDLEQAVNTSLDAAGAMADFDGVPLEPRYLYLDFVAGCLDGRSCTVTLESLDPDERRRLNDDARKADSTLVDADGMAIIAWTGASNSSGEIRMPYARVAAGHRLVAFRPTAERLAFRRNVSAENVLDQLMKSGVHGPASGTTRTDWATAASRLPAGGGEAGAALLLAQRRLLAAADARDPDDAMRAGDRGVAMQLVDTSFDGKPVTRESRQRTLTIESMRVLRDLEVSGGYRLGDDVLLAVEGRNGIGWIETGVIVMSKVDDNWEIIRRHMYAAPAK